VRRHHLGLVDSSSAELGKVQVELRDIFDEEVLCKIVDLFQIELIICLCNLLRELKKPDHHHFVNHGHFLEVHWRNVHVMTLKMCQHNANDISE